MDNNISGKKVSLVLGSGGARGLAHIGVIKVLEEKGAIIDEVVGCSMGSVIGGLYASGKLDVFEEWVSSLTKLDVLKLMDFSLTTTGLMKGVKIINKLKEIIPDTNIESLPISFSATVTELTREKDLVIRSGNIYDAIRASIGVPGIFTALNQENKIIVDGGVLNPLPLNHVTKKEENIVVAVNLDAYPKKIDSNLAEKQNVVSLLQQSYNAIRRRLSILALEIYKPNYVIHIPDNIVSFWEFEKASFLIEEGKNRTINALEMEQ